MYILNVCENPDILGVIYFILKLIDILLIAIPIGLIVFITIDVFKMIVSDDKGVKDAQKMVINRLIFAVAIFFIPTIVTLIMNLLTIAGIDVEYKSCITNATKENIESFRNMKDIESGNNNGNNNGGNGNSGSGNIENNEDEKAAENAILEKLADQMIVVAQNELGTAGTGQNGNDTPYGKNGAWCAKFVTWVAKNTFINTTNHSINLYEDIINLDNYIVEEARALGSIYAFDKSEHLNFYYSRAKKSLAGDKYTDYKPKKGDYVYMERDGIKWNGEIIIKNMPSGHIGIVEKFDGTYIYIIEGNTHGTGTKYPNNKTCTEDQWCVERKKYTLDNKLLIGFGSWYN